MTTPESTLSQLERVHQLLPEAFKQQREEILAKLALQKTSGTSFPQIVDPSVMRIGDVLRNVDAFDAIVRRTNRILDIEVVGANPRCLFTVVRIGDYEPGGNDRYTTKAPSIDEYFAAESAVTEVCSGASLGLAGIDTNSDPQKFFTYAPGFLIATAEDYPAPPSVEDEAAHQTLPHVVDTSWQTWAFEC